MDSFIASERKYIEYKLNPLVVTCRCYLMTYGKYMGDQSAPDGGYRQIPWLWLVLGFIAAIFTANFASQYVGWTYGMIGSFLIYGGIFYLRITGNDG